HLRWRRQAAARAATAGAHAGCRWSRWSLAQAEAAGESGTTKTPGAEGTGRKCLRIARNEQLSSGQIEHPEGCDPLHLLAQDGVTLQVEGLAEGGEVEQVVAQLHLQHLTALLAQGAVEVGAHVVPHFPVRDARWDLLALGVHLKAAALGDGP